MMMTITSRAVFVIALLAVVSASGHCASVWDSFLQKPTNRAFTVLKSAILSAPQRCGQKTQLTHRQTDTLFAYIQDGSPVAFRAAALMSSCFDGGDLEDYFRSVGVYFTKHPRDFLDVAYKERISDEYLRYMITMLPLSLVDNFDAQHAEISKRILLLKAIHDRRFIKIRDKLLMDLEKLQTDN